MWVIKDNITNTIVSPHFICEEWTGKEPYNYPTEEYAKDAAHQISTTLIKHFGRKVRFTAVFYEDDD